MAVSIETFRKVALEDDDGVWEYHCGRLVRKPPMTMPHNELARELLRQLILQIDPDLYSVSLNAGHVRLPNERYAVPDVAVIPRALVDSLRAQPHDLEEYSAPLPFVAEIWSRSTGEYDVEGKFPAYRERKDQEIWRIHPYEHHVTAWRLQPDGSYIESRYESGVIDIASLAGVSIDLGRLFRY
jgi:Uma2 family endonuclease